MELLLAYLYERKSTFQMKCAGRKKQLFDRQQFADFNCTLVSLVSGEPRKILFLLLPRDESWERLYLSRIKYAQAMSI